MLNALGAMERWWGERDLAVGTPLPWEGEGRSMGWWSGSGVVLPANDGVVGQELLVLKLMGRRCLARRDEALCSALCSCLLIVIKIAVVSCALISSVPQPWSCHETQRSVLWLYVELMGHLAMEQGDHRDGCSRGEEVVLPRDGCDAGGKYLEGKRMGMVLE